jgi:hypothetical protein
MSKEDDEKLIHTGMEAYIGYLQKRGGDVGI